jgi:hypothetical protein
MGLFTEHFNVYIYRAGGHFDAPMPLLINNGKSLITKQSCCLNCSDLKSPRGMVDMNEIEWNIYQRILRAWIHIHHNRHKL